MGYNRHAAWIRFDTGLERPPLVYYAFDLLRLKDLRN
jgi:hypothetical protein